MHHTNQIKSYSYPFIRRIHFICYDDLDSGRYYAHTHTHNKNGQITRNIRDGKFAVDSGKPAAFRNCSQPKSHFVYQSPPEILRHRYWPLFQAPSNYGRHRKSPVRTRLCIVNLIHSCTFCNTTLRALRIFFLNFPIIISTHSQFYISISIVLFIAPKVFASPIKFMCGFYERIIHFTVVVSRIWCDLLFSSFGRHTNALACVDGWIFSTIVEGSIKCEGCVVANPPEIVYAFILPICEIVKLSDAGRGE